MSPSARVGDVRIIKRMGLAAMVCALFAAFTPSVSAVVCDGTALGDGCLFTVTGGDTPDPDDGFAVTNAYDVPLWDFVKARDLDALGYPISRRWTDGPFTLQAFQKVILQWHPGKRQMNYFNTLDALANRYPEVELPFVPGHQVLEADRGMDFETVTRNHLALLEQNPAIQQRFLADPDWLNLYGLPIRYEEREVDGNPQGVQLLRTQRTVFAVWNVPAPGTTIGRVLLQNTPDQVKKLRDVIIPDRVKQPVRDIDPAVAAAIHALPWATDGVGPLEQDAIQRLQAIANLSPDIFWHLLRDMHLPWETGHIIHKPIHSSPNALTLRSLALTIQVASIAWIQDDLTEFEHLAARILTDSAFMWPDYVEAVLERAWLHDGLTVDERRVLDRTFASLFGKTLFPGNPLRMGQLNAEMVRMPYMDTIEGDEARVGWSLALASTPSFDAQATLAGWEGVVSYLASKGGATDELALIFEIHGSDKRFIDSITDFHDPTQFDQYLVDPDRRGITIERRQISLPLAGSTQLTVLREVPVSAQTMDVLEQSVRVVEGIMGVAYPTRIPGVVISPRFDSSGNTPFFAIGGEYFPTGEIPRELRSTFIHEAAHHYWGGTASWIVEGAPRFIQFKAGYISEQQLKEWRVPCLQKWKRLADIPKEGLADSCPYTLGANLFLDLYNALGNDTFHHGFRKLYLSFNAIDSRYHEINHGYITGDSPETGDYCDYCGGVDPSLYYLRLAFVDGADPANAATANHIITHWYYGPQE